jgi:PGF-pre-PGF domain-containing protein
MLLKIRGVYLVRNYQKIICLSFVFIFLVVMASNVTVADTLEVKTLTKVASNVSSVPIWSPDGSGFLVGKDGGLCTIFLNGSVKEITVENSTRNLFWSPDGSKISYLKYEGDALSLWIMGENGTKTQLLEPVYGVEHYTYTWFPSSSKIAYTYSYDYDFLSGLYFINPDGSNDQRVCGGANQNIAVSPDESKIVYNRYSTADPTDIYILDLNQNNSRYKLANGSISQQTQAGQPQVWSPDGSKIVYCSYEYRNNDGIESGNYCIYSIKVDGTEKTQLTFDSYSSSPVFSPDGSKIVFVSDITGNKDIWVMDADGENKEQFTTDSARDYSPEWSPDGTKIAFISEMSGTYDLWVMELKNQTEESLVVDILNPEDGFSVDVGSSELIKAKITDDSGANITGLNWVTATFSSGDDNLSLFDDGAHSDENPEDGIYANEWIPTNVTGAETPCTINVSAQDSSLGFAEDSVTGIIRSSDITDDGDSAENQTEDDDNSVENQTKESLVINILNPEDGFSVDAGSSELIKAKITDDSGANITGLNWVTATFSNGDDNLSLFDDGAHSDENPEDGIYANEWIPTNVTGAETPCTINVSAQDSSLGFAEDSVTGIIRSSDITDDGDSAENQTEESTNVTDEADEQSNETSISDDSSSSSGSGGGSSHSSSGSGGGGGVSPEPVKNIEVKELAQAFVTNGKEVKFDFTKNATCVVYVGFDAKKTAGKITTIAEQLKNKSSLVSGIPEGEVYKYFNIWVGNSGFASSKNIENPVIGFKVEKSWLQNNSVDPASITLNRYDDDKWEQFQVNMLGEDAKYLYFRSDVSGYSSFAITGKVIGVSEEKENNFSSTRSVNSTSEDNNTGIESETKMSSPGFELVFGIVSLLGVFLCKRK